ncbi:hypothetical protein ACH4SK_40280 [Streptomyces inhibens]|uniref:hypothetical protein n=1 Tax=Streptomyces inhibens TaxID=2293571 RepID=UPI00378AE0C2
MDRAGNPAPPRGWHPGAHHPDLTPRPEDVAATYRQLRKEAARVVMNSVIFRASGQNLTPVGTYVEMASRFFEPVLLALAVLAVRARVKRQRVSR